MRQILGTQIAAVATAVVLAGCGSASSGRTNQPGGPAYDPAGNPSLTPGPLADARVLPMISMTGGGGRPSTVALALDTRAEVMRFVLQLRAPAMQHRLRAAIEHVDVPDGHRLVGQVVAVGCDRPPGVDVVVTQGGQVELRPQQVASPLEECLAAVTTVALAVIPA